MIILLSVLTISIKAQRLRDTFAPENIAKLGSITDVPPAQYNHLCTVLEATNWTMGDKDDDGSDGEMSIVAVQNMVDNYGTYNPTGNPHNVFKIHFIKEDKFRVDEIFIIFNDLMECQAFTRALQKADYEGGKGKFKTFLTVGSGQIFVDVEVEEKDYLPTATIKFTK